VCSALTQRVSRSAHALDADALGVARQLAAQIADVGIEAAVGRANSRRPSACSISSSRLTVRVSAWINSSRMRSSALVSVKSRPSTMARCARGIEGQRPEAEHAGPGFSAMRRRIARMRATSSRGLKGLAR